MLIQCPQQMVKDILIETDLRSSPTGGLLIDAHVLKVIRETNEVDPFQLYYRAAREKITAPHHAFANMATEDDLIAFFAQHGFPYYDGDRLMVSEVLILAKRLRLVMEACAAFQDRDWAMIRQLIGELRFALRWDAHWYYWPPSIHATGDAMSQKEWEETRRFKDVFIADMRKDEHVRAADLADEKLLMHLHGLIHEVCVEPIKMIEFTPSVELAPRQRRDQRQATLTWWMRPVHYLGEHPYEHGTYSEEEPMLSAPYGLMYLLDLSDGTETRVCIDKSCRNVFGAGRADQIFCGNRCAHRATVRRGRDKARARKRT